MPVPANLRHHAMAPFKDLLRLVSGASLVAAEAAKRSQPLAAARSGDIEALVSKTLKSALLSVTDLAGFTKGRVHEVSAPFPKGSVVYFSDPPEPATPRSDPAEASASEVPVSERKVEAEELEVGSQEKTVNSVDLGEKSETEEEKVVKLARLGEENEKGSREVAVEEKVAEQQSSWVCWLGSWVCVGHNSRTSKEDCLWCTKLRC